MYKWETGIVLKSSWCALRMSFYLEIMISGYFHGPKLSSVFSRIELAPLLVLRSMILSASSDYATELCSFDLRVQVLTFSASQLIIFES